MSSSSLPSMTGARRARTAVATVEGPGETLDGRRGPGVEETVAAMRQETRLNSNGWRRARGEDVVSDTATAGFV
jgi:hypothetical protein